MERVVRDVVERVVVVVVVEDEREGMALVRKACETETAACLPFELDMWLCKFYILQFLLTRPTTTLLEGALSRRQSKQ